MLQDNNLENGRINWRAKQANPERLKNKMHTYTSFYCFLSDNRSGLYSCKAFFIQENSANPNKDPTNQCRTHTDRLPKMNVNR